MDRSDVAPRSQREYELQRDRAKAEIGKLIAESRKIDKEGTWYPFVAGAAFMGGLLALLKLLLN